MNNESTFPMQVSGSALGASMLGVETSSGFTGLLAAAENLRDARYTIKRVNGRTRIVFGEGVDQAGMQLASELTRDFHAAKIAALQNGSR